MPRENRFGLLRSVLLIFLLIFGVFRKHCDSQVNREEANKPPDGRRGDGSAFFAMRSCQQLLRGDDGEFFSPDYLCSNPPLWCNWTIQVDPAKRIHLHLEDLTPNDDCFLKEDQVHVDEPAGGHRVLQKCWREARYTSSSNILYVVLLIGGWPSPPYRGFYGRYRAFGPPVVYNPQEEFTEANRKSEPSAGLVDINEMVMNEEQMDSDLPRRENQPPESETNRHIHPSDAVSTVPTFIHVTAWSKRGVAPTPWAQSDSAAPPTPPQQQHGGQNQGPRPTASIPMTTQTNVEEALGRPEEALGRPEEALGRPEEALGRPEEALGRPEEALARPEEALARPEEALARPEEALARPEEALARPEEALGRPEEALGRPEEAAVQPQEAAVPEEEERSVEGENRTEVREASDQLPVPTGAPEPEKTEQTRPHPFMVDLLSDHRGNLNIRNHSHSDVPHLPGDHLFEVALEVNLRPGFEETWDDLSRSLLLPVKALISEQLKALRTPLSMTSKRIKRLSTGVLYILWLQIGQEHGGPQVHKVLLSGLQGLITAGNDVGGNRRKAVLIFVSIADVNECGTRLVLCDANADCVNQFGSYSCRCRPGFQDKSRQGSGGTVCVEGCSSGLSAETKGVYVLFFLLSFFTLMLLVAAGLLFHRHQRGEFLVRCHSDGSGPPPDPNPPHHPAHHCRLHDASDLPPPPPPPARGFRESWPQTKERYPVADLPLLSFSPLLPPDGFKERKLGSDQSS